MNKKENLLLTEFDVATLTHELQMMKSFIPFMDMPQQKSFAFFIRVFELIKTIDFYNNMSGPCPLHRKSHDKKDIFNEIKCYCPQKDKEIFEMMSNMDNLTEYYNMFQAMSSAGSSNSKSDSPDNNKQSNMLKSFLSPKQQEMYESYQKMLNL